MFNSFDSFFKCVKITTSLSIPKFRKQNLFLSSCSHSIYMHYNFQIICWKSCRIMSIYRKHFLVKPYRITYAILITVFEIQTFPGHSILRYSYLFPSRSSRRFVQWLIILLGNVPRLRFILNELSRMIFEHESPKSLHILSFSCPRWGRYSFETF